MRRFSVSLILGMLALLVFALPASAARTWCRADPIVTLNGEAVQIWFEIEAQYEPLVTGPIEVKILTAKRVKEELIFVDKGFNGHGEVVKFDSLAGGKVYKDGSFDVEVIAHVPIDQQGLRAMGMTSRTVPFRIIIETNGELVRNHVLADGSVVPWDVINSQVSEIEQNNDRTKIAFIVTPN